MRGCDTMPCSALLCAEAIAVAVAQLADFGFSKDANQHSAPTSRVGTPAYLAPEVISNQPGQVYDGQVRPGRLPLWCLAQGGPPLARAVQPHPSVACRERTCGPAACCCSSS